MLTISNLNYSYIDTKIFENFNLNVNEGEFLMIFGKNGSGKSTLAKLITGVLLANSGQICIDGLDCASDDIWKIRRRLGIVFQNSDDQFIGTTLFEELSFILENYNLDNINGRVDEALKLVGLLSKKDQSIDTLSGGEKQKLAIASALLLEPNLIVIDEATAMLDVQSRNSVMELLKGINSTGVTIICITHFIEEISYASRVMLLEEGKNIIDSTPMEFLKHDLSDHNILLPLYLKIAVKLEEKGVTVNLKESQTVLDKICQYM